jgi:hypothetical protein
MLFCHSYLDEWVGSLLYPCKRWNPSCSIFFSFALICRFVEIFLCFSPFHFAIISFFQGIQQIKISSESLKSAVFFKSFILLDDSFDNHYHEIIGEYSILFHHLHEQIHNSILLPNFRNMLISWNESFLQKNDFVL